MIANHTIGGMTFDTQKDLIEHVRSILRRYENGATLDMFDSAFMAELLQRHPDADQKIGDGIARFLVEDNPVYPGKRSRGFFLIRIDGSRTDFSFMECIKPSSHHKRVADALRAAVEAHVMNFKRMAFDASPNGLLLCPDTNELLRFTTAHVDHRAPKTFDVIVQMFLAQEGLKLDDIQIEPHKDNTYQDHLVNVDLCQRWVSYHADNAEMEIVSRLANLSIRKIRRE